MTTTGNKLQVMAEAAVCADAVAAYFDVQESISRSTGNDEVANVHRARATAIRAFIAAAREVERLEKENEMMHDNLENCELAKERNALRARVKELEMSLNDRKIGESIRNKGASK